ncbi:hypothetical protein ABTB37_19790, partial [Acinetobacter baumannii]
MRLRFLPLFAVMAALPAPAFALDLLAVIKLAEQNDPNLAAVRATRQAAELGTSITRAGLLPR